MDVRIIDETNVQHLKSSQDDAILKNMCKILVTGAAGFIGARVACLLADRGDEVVGVDNINGFYYVKLKYARLKECGVECENEDILRGKWYQSTKFPNYRFVRLSIESKEAINLLFGSEHFDKVIHLAAQAGVQFSKKHPYEYMKSNLDGFEDILEACRWHKVNKLVFASSSSVYGMNQNEKFSEEDPTNTPVSLYAASKIANEAMAHCYAHQYGINCIGLRFFTVYGPWGRPDMSPMLFADKIRKNKTIKLYGKGEMIRDFTYIDDIVHGVICATDYELNVKHCPNKVPFRIYNIGNGHPIKMKTFLEALEKTYGEKSKFKLIKVVRSGDVIRTSADTSRIESELHFKPKWNLEDGLEEFIKWYKSDKNPLK